MRISDWSSDVCSSDLPNAPGNESWTNRAVAMEYVGQSGTDSCSPVGGGGFTGCFSKLMREARAARMGSDNISWARLVEAERRSEENTSELQSLMRISYAVFCLKKKYTSRRHHPRP